MTFKLNYKFFYSFLNKILLINKVKIIKKKVGLIGDWEIVKNINFF